MSRDRTQIPGHPRQRTTGKEAARASAWQRQESARRERTIQPRSGKHSSGPHAGRRRQAIDEEGIQRVESTAERVYESPDGTLTGGPYSPPAHDTETASRRGAGGAGNGGGATPGGETDAERIAAAARVANSEREQPLYAAPRAWHESAESVDADSQPVGRHSAEQTEILARMLASMLIVASDLPARARSAQWPVGEDGRPAGEFWRIGAEEGMELGRAWAAVIAIYAPPDLIGGAGVFVGAMLATSVAIGSRVVEDVQRGHIVAARKAEMDARAAAVAAA